jgi:LysR family transcriptional regulator, nitrogen assimilation regulatory protein
MKPTDHQLRVFLEIADTGSLRLAAEKLGVTQPALSKQMRALESAMGVAVFRRNGRGMALTAFGEQVKSALQRHYAELDAALESLGGTSGSSSTTLKGSITVACVNTLALYLMPDVIESLLRAHPQLKVCLLAASSPDVVEKVARGQADIGLVYDQVVDTDDFIVHRLFMETLACYAAKILDCPDDCPREYLQSQALIVPPKPYAIRRVLERELDSQLKVCIECNDIAASLDLASRGLGLALLPAHLPDVLINKYPLKRSLLLGGSLKRTVVAITKQSDQHSNMVKAVLAMVRECALSVVSSDSH